MILLWNILVMPLDINDLIKIYDTSLDKTSCEYLINLFDTTSTENIYNLTDNINLSSEVNSIHQDLLKIVINTRNEYYQYCCGNVFPDSHAFEKFNILKISPEDEESTRVDIINYQDARRFLCFTWFLNDNPGGQVNFLDLTIQPEVGKLLVYPPFWMFPHKDLPPVETPKYILTTYLHYK